MSDLVYTLMLIGGFLVLALVVRGAERWCETHPAPAIPGSTARPESGRGYRNSTGTKEKPGTPEA
ncbi:MULTISPECIES: hypothetical protein [unclassified Amycolatopsis]|uniref:hypothetical protein n=1 Tax=unclassified Amycolatopsis TaxID=2618356 RepID=UPI002E20353E|nr:MULTISPECIES: hypothetical protein [unclassified Amycolatopsis]